MALTAEGNGGTTETAAERNARLQAQFDQSSTSAPTTSTTYVPSTPAYVPPATPAPAPQQNLDQRLYELPQYGTPPAVPDLPEQQYSIFGEPIDLSPGAQIGLSFADVPLGQGDASDFYSQGGIPQDSTQATQQDYWGDFYSQGTSQGAPSSWTESELEMLGGMDVQQAINWGANYTGQALFGGWNVATNEFFTGAFDMQTGELVNPSMMPSLLSPEFSTALGISEEQRVMMGYSPEYPYELQQPLSGGGGGGGGGSDAGGSDAGGYSPGSGYGYSPSSQLMNWRIGF